MHNGRVWLSRHAVILSVAALALVIVELPGATSASSTPARPPGDPTAVATAPPASAESVRPAVLEAPPEPPRAPVTPPIDQWLRAMRVLREDLERFAQRVVAGGLEPPDGADSYFDHAMVVSLYGHPDSTIMGELGFYDPVGAAREARRVAEQYAALSPGREVVPALHLIVDVAQASPQDDGSYLLHMPVERVQEYVEAARQEQVLLFLDFQIGWADPLTTVQRLEEVLALPFVHVALDPEFATKHRGEAPGIVIGALDATAVNEVQAYLAGLVQDYHLPRKVLVLHQFLEQMLPNPTLYDDVPEVEITVDMDGFGPDHVKETKYGWFALADYSERAAIKLFYHWDEPLMSPADVLALEQVPDYVIYQ